MFELRDSKPSIADRVATRAAAWPAWRSPFGVLCRTFFGQFFTNESVTSDVHLRQTIIWALAFLLVPGMFLMINLLPAFAFTVIHANSGRIPASRVDDLLVWSAFLLTTYSMASMGFITVLAWDSLTFNRRDAMVLGALPLSRRTILGAKLCALGAFLLAGSIPVNLLNATVFASVTADLLGGSAVVRHFIGLLTATVGAGVLCFATIIAVRAMVTAFGGPRLASACGPPLQFLFVVAMLSLLISCAFGVHISFANASFTNGMPSAWFAGLFETIRGSPRVFDPTFGFWMLAQRALVATPIALLAAVVMSIVEFRRHMRFALAPPASPGFLGRAPVGRSLASLIVGRDLSARATCDFILLTLARNRTQQAPIAINSAWRGHHHGRFVE